MTLQNSLANYSFLTLLGSMIFYWIETSFTGVNLVKKKVNLSEALRDSESLVHNKQMQTRSLIVSPLPLYASPPRWPGVRWPPPAIEGAAIEPPSLDRWPEAAIETPHLNERSGVALISRESPFSYEDTSTYIKGEVLRRNAGVEFLKDNKSVAKYGIFISNILLGLLLLLRWKESGHFPLSNLYESLMFLSWCFTGLHLYIDNYTSLPTSLQKENNEFVRKLLGAITTPSALLTNAFATFTLPKEMQEAAPLVPALQSNWLMMHVTVMILSYAALILGSLMSIAFLIVTAEKSFLPKVNFNLPYPQELRGFFLFQKEKENRKETQLFPLQAREASKNQQDSTIALTLDNLSYRILGIGFPLLTIGILSGAVWANEAWGSYWSWDPKETWALLTWLIFAIYLHTRLSKGWEGKKPAIIASVGFLIVWMCYLGVNLIGEGLHSYGWIVQS